MKNTHLLNIDGLRTYFKTGEGTARAVDGVSFHIDKGETFALVGESGCGKSVTALSILQLVAQPAGYIAGGSIKLGGEEISTLPPFEMRAIRGNRISMIFQEPMTALNPVFTIGDQISEVSILHQGMSRAAAKTHTIEMLEKVGIPDPAKRHDEYPHQMSGGMRQRVMIAMALACRPELLIADEPTTALDVTIQAQILTLINDLKDELGTAVLLITHDMGVVRENADRVGVMYAGKLVEEADINDIFDAPSHPYTQLLLQSLPSKARKGDPLTTIRGIVPKPTSFPTGCRFSTRCPFVMDRCHSEEPARSEVSNGHTAECFLLSEGKSAAATEPASQSDSVKPNQQTLNTSQQLDVCGLKMHFPIRKGVFRSTVGHVMAVDGVDMTIKGGETAALVGESGCGKTTVGKCIIDLLTPTDGSISFRDSEESGSGPVTGRTLNRKIQMIFQDPFSSLNPRLMIADTITEGMTTHGIGRNRRERLEMVRKLMNRVGLNPDMLNRYPHEFSGGQRQRIGVARALAVDPELVICDEATSSLDVSVQAQILNLLKELQLELGLAYLFVTHDLSVVRYLADRVYVMYLGRIVEEGTNEEIFQDARHPYTSALLSAVPSVDKETGHKRIILGGDVPSPISPPGGCHFHPRCPEAMPECSERYPDAIQFGPTHMCKCVLYKERN